MSEFLSPELKPAIGVGLHEGTVRSRGNSLLEDQNLRWLRGDRVSVEDYLARQGPALHNDPDALLDLIYNEIRLREEAGESPEIEDFLRRFPDLQDQLRLLFEVHRAM